MTDILETAARWGIEPDYVDVRGRRQTASDDTIRRIVTALSAAEGEPAVMPQGRSPHPVAYQGDGRRGWLLAVQLYGLRSARNWGHGDFSDLATLIEIAASLGAAGIGLNPLHALFPDRPEHASPYAPNSRLFLNPLYIDVAALPEFSAGDGEELITALATLRAAETVDYAGVADRKLEALHAAYAQFSAEPQPERADDFAAFRRDRGAHLLRFAAFETLRDRFDGPWWQWPEEWRRPDDRLLAELRERESEAFGFQEYLQWNADRQLRACARLAALRGMPVGLFIDLAIGVDAAGADAWMDQSAMMTGLSVGAPPDAYTPAGQDWGLTTYSPHGLAAHGIEPLKQMLRGAMRHAGAVRLDHVLGLMRLYVIPHGAPARAGAYLRFPLHAMLDAVADESLRDRCIVIGEDLGTVPEGFREALAEWGIWSYHVALFEREDDGRFRDTSQYVANAVATFNTHDMPTFTGWLSGHDLNIKRSIDVDPGETDEQRSSARHFWRAAIEPNDPARFDSAVAFLAAAPSRMISVAIEDILELVDQINVPGTTTEHPNWRRRMPIPIEDLASDQRMLRVAATFARFGRG